MFRRNRGNGEYGAISMLQKNIRIKWESQNYKDYGDSIFKLMFMFEPEENPDLFQKMLPTTPEGEIEWILACMEWNRMELIKEANIQPPEKLQKIIDLINNDVYPKVSDIEVPVYNNPNPDQQPLQPDQLQYNIKKTINNLQLDQDKVDVDKLSDALYQYILSLPYGDLINYNININKDNALAIITKDGVIKDKQYMNELINKVMENTAEPEKEIVVVEERVDDIIDDIVEKLLSTYNIDNSNYEWIMRSVITDQIEKQNFPTVNALSDAVKNGRFVETCKDIFESELGRQQVTYHLLDKAKISSDKVTEFIDAIKYSIDQYMLEPIAPGNVSTTNIQPPDIDPEIEKEIQKVMEEKAQQQEQEANNVAGDEKEETTTETDENVKPEETQAATTLYKVSDKLLSLFDINDPQIQQAVEELNKLGQVPAAQKFIEFALAKCKLMPISNEVETDFYQINFISKDKNYIFLNGKRYTLYIDNNALYGNGVNLLVPAKIINDINDIREYSVLPLNNINDNTLKQVINGTKLNSLNYLNLSTNTPFVLGSIDMKDLSTVAKKDGVKVDLKTYNEIIECCANALSVAMQYTRYKFRLARVVRVRGIQVELVSDDLVTIFNKQLMQVQNEKISDALQASKILTNSEEISVTVYNENNKAFETIYIPIPKK